MLCATLHVDVSNSAALGLYKKAGFVEVRLLSNLHACRSGVTHWYECYVLPQGPLLDTIRHIKSVSSSVAMLSSWDTAQADFGDFGGHGSFNLAMQCCSVCAGRVD